jgi:hypothetical protein
VQFIISLDMGQWEEWKKVTQAGDCLMKHRKEWDEGAPQQQQQQQDGSQQASALLARQGRLDGRRHATGWESWPSARAQRVSIGSAGGRAGARAFAQEEAALRALLVATITTHAKDGWPPKLVTLPCIYGSLECSWLHATAWTPDQHVYIIASPGGVLCVEMALKHSTQPTPLS